MTVTFGGIKTIITVFCKAQGPRACPVQPGAHGAGEGGHGRLEMARRAVGAAVTPTHWWLSKHLAESAQPLEWL